MFNNIKHVPDEPASLKTKMSNIQARITEIFGPYSMACSVNECVCVCKCVRTSVLFNQVGKQLRYHFNGRFLVKPSIKQRKQLAYCVPIMSAHRNVATASI